MYPHRDLDRKQYLKSFIFRLVGPHAVRKAQSIFLGETLDEVDLAYDYFAGQASTKQRVMVDVGAHFGTSMARFAADGWQVHAFEPDNFNRLVLNLRHGHRKNVTFNNKAVSDESGGTVSYFSSGKSTGISGLEAFDETHQASQTVELINLTDYCAENAIAQIDFLKIDTEGHDLLVLKGLNFETQAPEVIVCEYEDRKTLPRGYDRNELAAFLEQQGYRLLISEWEPIKDYGTKHKWKTFRQTIDETADNSWGNIVAFKGDLPWGLIDLYSSKFGSGTQAKVTSISP